MIPLIRSSGWLREPGVTSGLLRIHSELRVTFRSHTELQVPVLTQNSEKRIPEFTRIFGFPESHGTLNNRFSESPGSPGFPIHPEIRVPRVITGSWIQPRVTPDSPGTTISHPDSRISGFTESPRVPGVARNNGFRVIPGNRSSGNSRNPVYTGTRNSGCLQQSGVPNDSPDFRLTPWNPCSGSSREHEVQNDSANPEFRVAPRSSWLLWEHGVDPGNPKFQVTPDIQISGCIREPGVPLDSCREPVFPSEPVRPESRVTPGTRSRESHPGIFRLPRNSGFPADVTRNSGFPDSPWTTGSRSHPGFPESPWTAGSRCSGRLWKPRVPGDSSNLEFRLTPVPGVLGDSGTSEFRLTPSTRSSVLLGEPEVPGEFPQFLLTPGTRSCLRLPGVLGYSVNTDFRATQGNRRSGRLQELGFPGDFWNAEFRFPNSVISEFFVILVIRSSLWIRETWVPDESGNL